MADLSYQVTVNTKQAQESLQKLQGSITATGRVMSALGATLATVTAGLGVREIVAATSAWTDLNSRLRNATGSTAGAAEALQAITDTARSTYTSIELTSAAFLRNAQTLNALGLTTKEQINISEALNNALAVSGTTGQQAESVMNALSKAFATGKLQGDNFNSVIENGDRVVKALADGLGVSILQLREMASTGQLTTGRVIEALTSQMSKLRQEAADMPATLRDGFTVLGNALRELLGAVDAATGGSASLGSILVDLADSIRSLARNAESLRTLAIVVIELVKAVALIGGAILTFTLLGKAISLLGTGIMALTGFVARFGTGIASIQKTLQWLGSSLRGIQNGTIPAGKALEVLERRFGFLGKGVSAVVGAMTAFGLAIFSAITAIRAYFSATDKIAKANEEAAKSENKLTAAQREAEEAAKKKAALAALAAIEEGKYRQAVAELTVELGRQGRAFRDNLAGQLENLRAQNSAINQTQQQQRLASELASLEKTFFAERIRLQDALQDAIRKSSDASKEDEDSKRRAAASIPLLEAQLETLSQHYKDQRLAIQGLLAVQEELSRARRLEEFALEQANRNSDQLLRLQREIARSGLSEIERKYQDIRDAADDAARAAIRAEEARRGTTLSTQEVDEYYRIARQGQERLIELTRAHHQASRTWSAGWRQAYKEYADNATNAARRAQDIFKKTMQGLEDLLVDFVKTGRFEWKNFVAMMLEELLRAQIQQIFAQIFNPNQFGGGQGQGQGGGLLDGIFDMIGGLFGGGGGARGQSPGTPMYVVDVGGGGGGLGGIFGGGQGQGQGGGLGSVISTIGSGIGKVVTGIAGGAGKVIGGVIDTVGKIGSGIGKVVSGIGSGIGNVIGGVIDWGKDLFSGFFANGGSIPAGRFGVVGERGPEFVGGPATVTPMMSPQQVVYNINAVDAASFRQLVARDPAFIHAVAQQGARTIPAARS